MLEDSGDRLLAGCQLGCVLVVAIPIAIAVVLAWINMNR